MLTDETLRRRSRLQSNRVNTEPANVRMRRDEAKTSKVFAVGNGHDGLYGVHISANTEAFAVERSELTAAIFARVCWSFTSLSPYLIPS
jgi:hypothetical protein